MLMNTLEMVAIATGGTLHGDNRQFSAVSTDSRTLSEGELFIALRGERFDAAEFVAEAERRGAAGAVVHAPASLAMPQIQVDDTRIALGRLADAWRQQFSGQVIGVTGSNGKTTVKEMLATILRAEFAADDAVLVTRGNLNNEIGLPLTVLELRPTHRCAVLEMGASKPGDIAYLADIAAPDVAIVTNAGSAHLEGFGSDANIAVTKGELFAALSGDGVAVINRDSPWFDDWLGRAGDARILTFGTDAQADFRAVDIRHIMLNDAPGLHFRLHAPGVELEIELSMAGSHNATNAVAAIAAAQAIGVDPEAARDGLAAMRNVDGRLVQLAGRDGATIFDDSYNANPVSVAAAIEFLADCDGETCLVLGDMAELGSAAEVLHADVGALAAERGIDRLWAVGPLSRAAARAFGSRAEWFADVDALTREIRRRPLSALTILVKASRSMRLERAVSALRAGDEVLH